MTTGDGYWDWLEEQKGSRCLEWVRNENKVTSEYLDALPRTEDLQAKLRSLSEKNTPYPTFFLASRIFRLVQNGIHKNGLLEMSDGGAPGRWVPVLDIDKLGFEEGKAYQLANLPKFAYYVYGPDPWRLLIALSDAGSDLVEFRELDIDSASFVADGFRTPSGRQSAAWLDKDTLLISHSMLGVPTSTTGWPINTYIWTRGTKLGDAKLVHSGHQSTALTISFNLGTGPQLRGLILECPDFSTSKFFVVSMDGTVTRSPLPESVLLNSTTPTTSNHIVVSLAAPAVISSRDVPPGTLLAWDVTLEKEGMEIVYILNEGELHKNIMSGTLTAGGSRVYHTVSNGGKETRVISERQADGTWKDISRVDAPTGSTAQVLVADRYSSRTLVTQTGLLTPDELWIEEDTELATPLHSQPEAFKGDDYSVKVQSAQSKDGTWIDYIELAPKQRKSPSHVLITGYGAFAITMPLNYLGKPLGGLALVPWLESGGSLVVALIRGGGDRGEMWHKAAMREKRQNSYDDFIAVCEKLISDGVAMPQSLGVFGTSNGGLLAAVVATQRPDLFGAVVSDVPLIDMIRFPLMGMGAAWTDEYGDPEDPEAAKVLHSYSPFHNVKPGVVYPPFLITSSTVDDRVGAGHGRKMAAKLKEVHARAFLYEQEEGGHGVSDTFKYTAFMARRTAFLMSELGV
ncbi:prolyl oligopeptidase family-domain-containing protein [Xylariales sp. PMI_506]|nr:prolyl oligopeptidase family-domain-containing protein [Xylariales sp. PMI_506]